MMTDEPKYKAEGKSNDKINIGAGEDVAFAKNNAKASQIKKSSVAVVGNNTNVKGGIHFYDKVMVCSFAVLIPFLTFVLFSET